MNRGGFIISTDAFIGLSLLAFIVVISFFYLSTTNSTAWNMVDLINLSRDEATVLEKQMVLENSIKQSSADLIISKLNATSNSFCFEVTIFSKDNLDIPILYALKTGRTKKFDRFIATNRTVVVNNGGSVDFYIAKIGVWHNE